jgi:uncharacterized repeat protein (TIGR03803 family)
MTKRLIAASAVLAITIGCAQAQAPTFLHLKILHSFGSTGDGTNPQAGLIAVGGALYGTTNQGGASGAGTVFKLTPPASNGGPWTEKVLYSFKGPPNDGAQPFPGLIVENGALYGTTDVGGTSNFGTVFKLTPPANNGGQWTETVLHSFAGSPNDGADPQAGLVVYQGSLYGTTNGGGTSSLGTVFEITLDDRLRESVVHNFAGAPNDGNGPAAGLIVHQGALYGTTPQGGASNNGTVFKVTPPVNNSSFWTEKVLYSFLGGNDGAAPSAGLIAENGALYSTTVLGGASNNGTVFKLTPPNNNKPWTEKVLYSFLSGGTDGTLPQASLIVYQGVFYGTTQFGGGGFNNGTVFQLKPPANNGGAWTERVLHSFMGPSTDGQYPVAGLIVYQGALYSTTTQGGVYSLGTVFKLDQGG